MHVTYRNVNQAFAGLVAGIANGEIPTRKAETRNGPVLQVDEPIIVTYEKPLERVLFNAERDANPFANLYESLWMIAGRNDVAPLTYYTENFKNYSDDGKILNGAYGYRWRHAKRHRYLTEIPQGTLQFDNVDQLGCIIDHLIRIPDSRRAVLQMWNVEDDLLKIGSDLEIMRGKESRDVSCNTAAYFALRKETVSGDKTGDSAKASVWRNYLDMTVTNRSNDLIYGMLGANVVHFSVLMEYMAAQLGVEVGKYHQFSNNLHVYTETNSGFKPTEWLKDGIQDKYAEKEPICSQFIPLVRDPVMFDKELPDFVEMNSGSGASVASKNFWVEPFFAKVAQPIFSAFHCHKQREYAAALAWCGEIMPFDWRLAATAWIMKRRKNYEAKQGAK